MYGTLILRGLGGLLLLAAGLKMYGLALEPIGRTGFFSQPWVHTAIVEWEIVLGLWLLWGRYRAGAWLAVTATFVVFTCVNFWQGWIGQASCGCFGKIQVNPWLTFAIDLTALGLLASTRQQALAGDDQQPLATFLRPVVLGAAGVFAMLGIFAGIGTATFGSPAAALAYLRGERLSVEPALVDVGDGYLGEQKEVVIQVRNWTDQPVRIVGGTSDCSCVVTKDLPLTVPTGEASPLTVNLALKGEPGQFTRLVRLFVEDERFRVLQFRLTGRNHAIPDSSSGQ